jgi:hypothetical protein
MMMIFARESLVSEFFGETTLQMRLAFRGGERMTTETISIRKRQRS